MKECFTSRLGLSKDNIVKLETINGICEEYRKEGYRLTLRQLYYQLVSRDIIPNNQKEYAKISHILKAGRMGGIVDWDIIEDRLRQPFIPYWVRDKADAIDDTIKQYRLDRMKWQPNYIELWVEKDALSGVLRPITSHYHINLMINRGYSSCSAMYDSANRYKRAQQDNKEGLYLLYLGDHDPSGLDMVRDIHDRLAEFEVEVNVEHLGLTTAQVKHYNPPPNPVKFTDSRSDKYVELFGETSWEVDALNPKILNQIIRKSIEKLIDKDLFQNQLDQEKEDKEKLQAFMETMNSDD